MDRNKLTYTIRFNRSRKTYTIREYYRGRLQAKYRTYPQGRDYSEHWTQHDIFNHLRYANDYYVVK